MRLNFINQYDTLFLVITGQRIAVLHFKNQIGNNIQCGNIAVGHFIEFE